MINMKLSWMKAVAMLFLAAVLSAPAWSDTHGANSALPGTLNYVEGQVSMGAETLNSKSVGSSELQTGQTLTTDTGKAEILLTPGVFLRLDDHSAATMVSPNLTDTQVEITRGRAMVEVAQLYKENDIRVLENGSITRLVKPGLYEFDAGRGQVRTLDGEALVRDGDHEVKLKGGHEISLDHAAQFKARKFDKKTLEASDLYRFSSLRSAYLAEANADAAHLYVSGYGYGPGWYGSGWYWDPWFASYTFIPGDGIFYSPFGYGFYSPFWVYRSPFWGGYGWRGERGRPSYGSGFRPPIAHPGAVGHAGPAAGGFRAGEGAFHGGGVAGGGGLHGGGGGFHGGSFGGRR
jgi:hypothetical protein